MLTEQERKALLTAVDTSVETANRMKSIIENIIQKRPIVEQLVAAEQSIDQYEAAKRVDYLIALIPRIDSFIKNISDTKTIDTAIPDVFKTFIQKELVLFKWSDLSMTSPYATRLISDFLNKQQLGKLNIDPQDADALNWLCTVFEDFPDHVLLLERKMSTYKIFDKIKWIDNNIVMIGANGSGKSTFARQLRGKISSNISILSAQHMLVYTPQNSIPSSTKEIQSIRNFQKNPKMSSADDFSRLISDEMNQLVKALIAEHTDKALAHYAGGTREKSFLESTIEIWKELIEHRSLEIGRGNISAKIQGTATYPFNSLSDGEKAVFYYVAHILLVAPNSYIIVDEPENHLHMAICSKLWDKLEEIRPDCKFIYLTHNLDFAASRNNTTLVWNKSFVPPDIWDFEIIESDGSLPDSLLMEVLGSRKQVCFCEGRDKSSLDYKLYSILFPQYTVIPVGGHLDVISYTNAYNKSAIRSSCAIGIIDGDCHKPEQISKWQEQGIYTIPLNEIENFLCDPTVLETAASTFMSGEDAVQKYYDLFWSELSRDIVQQVVWYVNNTINNKFKENFLHEKQSIDSLKAELLNITSAEEIDTLYQDRLTQLETLIERKDYEKALKIVNFKGKLTKHIAKNTIVDNYQDRVLGLIKSINTLQELLKQKYFSMIS